MTGRRLPQIDKLKSLTSMNAWRSKSPGPFIAIVARIVQT
jgi:hypothetical protein